MPDFQIGHRDLTECQVTRIASKWLSADTPRSFHYNDVIMSAMASQIASLTIVYSTVYSGADKKKHQSSASLVFVRGIHRWPVNSPHKGPVTRKTLPFDDVIMYVMIFCTLTHHTLPATLLMKWYEGTYWAEKCIFRHWNTTNPPLVPLLLTWINFNPGRDK